MSVVSFSSLTHENWGGPLYVLLKLHIMGLCDIRQSGLIGGGLAPASHPPPSASEGYVFLLYIYRLKDCHFLFIYLFIYLLLNYEKKMKKIIM